MKYFLLSLSILLNIAFTLQAQVTMVNSNGNLESVVPLSNGLTIFTSGVDSTLWASDGTLAGTIQLSTTIKFSDEGSILNGKLIFIARTDAAGFELFTTDGTPGGTMLLSDINPGAVSSSPDLDFATLNGFVYFTASRPAEGRELWRTNGTPGGTTLFKDVVPGTADGNAPDSFNLWSNGTYLLFSARTATEGTELWMSNGTAAGTNQLKDINPGSASSFPVDFYSLNNLVIFSAKDAAHGVEYWKTDGTPGGTVLLKDINPGPGNSYSSSNFLGFQYIFKNKAFFIANDGTTGDEVWVTDGQEANTKLLKDIHTSGFALTLIFNSVAIGDKFFFATSNMSTSRFEIWSSDGTTTGTQLFKSFTPADASGSPFIYPPYVYDFEARTVTTQLFQGNKFFFSAGTAADGNELWVSDGTLAGTMMVKNIGPGSDNGVNIGTFAYTSNNFYFAADDGVNGLEPWKTNGSSGGTSMVSDINPTDDSDPGFTFFINNGKLFFTADNGDNATARDLYVISGVLPLPINLIDFTVSEKTGNALINWATSVEINNQEFVIERSLDGNHFTAIGTTKPLLTANSKKAYSFTDWNIGSLGVNKIFYRLKQLDKDGSATLSRIVGLTIKGSKLLALKIIGNPATSILTVEISGNNDKVQFGIRDVNGRSLSLSSTYSGNGFISLPISNLKPGVYLLVAETGEGQKTLKFIKK